MLTLDMFVNSFFCDEKRFAEWPKNFFFPFRDWPKVWPCKQAFCSSGRNTGSSLSLKKKLGTRTQKGPLVQFSPALPSGSHCCKPEAQLGTSLAWKGGFCKTPTFVPQGHSCQVTVPHHNCNSTMLSPTRECIPVHVGWKQYYYKENLNLARIHP